MFVVVFVYVYVRLVYVYVRLVYVRLVYVTVRGSVNNVVLYFRLLVIVLIYIFHHFTLFNHIHSFLILFNYFRMVVMPRQQLENVGLKD